MKIVVFDPERRIGACFVSIKILFIGAWLFVLSAAIPSHAAEGLQKLRVAYAAITAAFSIPWIAKEAGIFQRHGVDVELVYIASGPR